MGKCPHCNQELLVIAPAEYWGKQEVVNTITACCGVIVKLQPIVNKTPFIVTCTDLSTDDWGNEVGTTREILENNYNFSRIIQVDNGDGGK